MDDIIKVEQNTIKLTVEGGIKIQTEQLADWKPKLLPEVYEDLVEYAVATNSEAKTGFDIRRGSDLNHFVNIWKPKTKELILEKNVYIEVGDTVVLKDTGKKIVISGFFFHLETLFVISKTGLTIKGSFISGIIKKM